MLEIIYKNCAILYAFTQPTSQSYRGMEKTHVKDPDWIKPLDLAFEGCKESSMTKNIFLHRAIYTHVHLIYTVDLRSPGQIRLCVIKDKTFTYST